MRLGWLEETFRNGEVVAADAEWILGDDASKSVQLDPLQGGVTVLEHAGRKPCLLTVEDPNGWWPGLYFGIGFTHGKNVYRPSARSPARHAHLPPIVRGAAGMRLTGSLFDSRTGDSVLRPNPSATERLRLVRFPVDEAYCKWEEKHLVPAAVVLLGGGEFVKSLA
jgi:hypothetical protein